MSDEVKPYSGNKTTETSTDDEERTSLPTELGSAEKLEITGEERECRKTKTAVPHGPKIKDHNNLITLEDAGPIRRAPTLLGKTHTLLEYRLRK